MPQLAKSHQRNPRARAAALAALAIILAVAVAAGAAGSHRAGKTAKRVVAAAENPTLGRTVLTSVKGRTLYSLSAEKNGRFICTGSCLSTWHPLLVPADARPVGPVRLGTIVRPDGKGLQVTYRGRPLYRFDGDGKAGEVNGEGIKDVGTWHAATAPAAQSAPPPGESPPAQEPPPSQPPYSGY